LKKHFDDFLKLPLQPAVFDLNTEKGKRIRDLFCECAEMKGSGTAEAELVITGNIYKILAYFMGEFSNLGEAVARERDLSQIESVEKALEQIYLHYREPLTVEGVADLVGYGKSNFCKIFKKTVGEGFHQALNRHRVACAEGLLKASRLSVAAVATEVGFADVKSFCRVFKAVKGISPGQYRKA
jgi:YesN/AraC family two-component response regulator